MNLFANRWQHKDVILFNNLTFAKKSLTNYASDK